ncbi:MAG: MATE family efflux transporter [Clostridia bacterium]|nr:MATE family efflux transporter [Clostridia bacterium]
MRLRNHEVDMLSGSIVKGLVAIALPIMVMNVLQSLFSIADMTVLKIYDTDGGYSVGAVGACGSLIVLITGLLIGISAGTNVTVARYIGRGEDQRVDRAVGTAILLAALGGIVLAGIGISFAEVFLRMVNCDPMLLPQAALYFRIYFAGVPILMVYNFSASILRASGDTRRPMLFLTLGGVINVILNFVFVAGLGMRVEGVAIATVISWAVSAILALIALAKNTGTVKIRRSRLRFYRRELSEMLVIGVPAGFQQALYCIANVIIAATVNSFGPDATTGISIANNFDGVLYQIVIAPSLAVMPYVSQNIGCGNPQRASKAVGRGMLLTVLIGATIGAFSAIFSWELSSIMSDNPAVIAYSCQKMVIISSTYFICGLNEILCAAMRGMGRSVIPTVVTLLYMCVFRFVWVYTIFPLMPNLTFLYLVWPVSWVLSIGTMLFFFFPTLKKLVSMGKGDAQKSLPLRAE